MNFSQFDSALATELGDPNAEQYTVALRSDAILKTAAEYSRYRPVKRRLRTGVLAVDASATDTSITCVGGPFFVGDVITVGFYPETPQTVTISSVALSQQIENAQPTKAVNLGLSSPLNSNLLSGTYVECSIFGITLVAGKSNYVLPLDFIKEDRPSFDNAVGIKAPGKKTDSFYNGYVQSSAFSGIGWGNQQNWGPNTLGAYPIAGDPSNNPNSGLGNLPTSASFNIVTSSIVPMLVVTPAPVTQAILDFDYFGTRTIDIIPDSDIEAIMAYAKATAMIALAAILGALENYNEDDVAENASQNAQALLSLAQAQMDIWDTKIRLVPYITSG